jgi:hypothetical protein
MTLMRTQKVTLVLDKQLLAEARAVAGGRALSRYCNRALRNQLRQDRLTGLLAALELDHGPIDAQVMAEVRGAWPAPGEQRDRSGRKAG